MLGHKRQNGRWLKDQGLGLKILAKRRLDLIPSRVRGANKEIADLFTGCRPGNLNGGEKRA